MSPHLNDTISVSGLIFTLLTFFLMISIFNRPVIPTKTNKANRNEKKKKKRETPNLHNLFTT